jgi:hypothetical protein
MPNYLFRNTVSGDIFQKTMKMSELDTYMIENPSHVRYYDGVAPAMGDPVRLGVRKMDTGFKEVLQRVHELTPGSTLNASSSQI